MQNKRKITEKIIAITLAVLHIITIGPVGETLAYNAQSANYRLYSGTPADGSPNKDSLTYKIANESIGEVYTGRTQSASYRITGGFVYSVSSNPPQFNGPIPSQSWPKNESLDNAFDLDDYFTSELTLTYTVAGNSQITVAMDPITNEVSFSQPAGYYGSETIYFTATDTENSSVNSNDIILQVLDINNPPILNPIPDITGYETDLITIDPATYAEETDGDPITFTFSPPFDANGQWQTDYHDGDGGSQTYIVTVTATDDDGSTSVDVDVTIINVNRPPVIEPIPDIFGSENELVTINPIVTDEDEEPIEVWFSQPFGSDGTWLPNYDDAGTYVVTVYASDDIDTVTENVNVIIENVNRPPVISLTLSKYTLEPNEEVQLILYASDPDLDNMTFVINKDGVEIASGSIADTYSMMLSFDTIGDHTVEAVVTDDGTPEPLFATDTKTANVIDPNADRYAITPVMGDFNGDSLTDLGLHDIDSGKWEIAISDGGTFLNTTVWLLDFGTSRNWIPISGDFNGDGLTDIGIYNNTTGSDGGQCQIALSTGASFEVSGTWAEFEESSYDWQPLTGDFNVDRYTDFALYNKDTGEVRVALSDGISFGEFTTWITDFGGDGHTIFTGDYNGDGLPDVCVFKKSLGEWTVALNNTQGFVDESVWITGYATDEDYTLVSDFNNDGLTDIGYWEDDTGNWYYAISTGMSFIDKGIWLTGFGGDFAEVVYTGDFNGDGITNPALFDIDEDGILKWTIDLSAGDFSDDPVKANLLVKIENGTGGITQISYDYASQFTNELLPFPVYVVKTITTIDTLPEGDDPEPYGQYISYSGGYYDAEDREFRGFAVATVTDPITSNYTQTHFYQGLPEQDKALKGKIEKVLSFDGTGAQISQVINTWEVREAGSSDGPLGFPYLKEAETTTWEEDGSYLTTKKEFIYDNLGNVTKAINQGDINNPDDTKISETVYAASYEEGYNRPLRTTLKDEFENIVTKKEFEYYADGNLFKETAYLNTDPDNSPYTVYSYDTFGNVTSTQNPNGAYVYTTYESTYRTFPESVTNELGHTIHYTYNAAFGVVETITDPNNNVTTSVYDTYGRLIQQLNPDSQIITSYSYPDFNTKITTQLNLITSEYVDGLGRTYKTVTSGEDADARRDVVKEVFYNERGHKDYETLPHYVDEPAQSFIRYSYDLRGRIISTTADYSGTSMDATSFVSYISPLITETLNAEGQKKTTVKDVYGNVVEVIEYNGATGVYHTYYDYDTQGNLITVTDAQGNETDITYDSLGRKISMTDPDMGYWSYQYDNMGNLIRQTDAKGQIIEFEYDILNRLTAKSVGAASGGETLASYEYDDPLMTNATGRLTTTTDSNGYTTTYNYDKEGRITSSIVTVDGLPYETSTTYDILGRTTSVTYPDGEVVYYTYDENSGQLEYVGAASGGEPVYITDIHYTATGQIKDILYGNQTKTEYTYRVDHKLQNITTLSSDGFTEIQNLGYEFDKVGNITTLVDNLESNIRGFIYDDLNRLTEASNVPDPQGGYTTISYQYNSIGNMTYKSDLGILEYGQGAGPHAVTSAGGYSYTYDANGNQIYGRTRTMEYDVENHLSRIITSSETVDFEYDTEGKRVKKISSAGTVTYISGSYEIRDINGQQRIIKHIYTGSDRSITVENVDGQTYTYYYHNDHLGSTNVVTDDSGYVVQECEYTPYGQVASNSGTYNSPYKFTGKELDDQTELYYYGARYYDPIICHFIQADTIVPQPLNPQTLNRYSYCYNNPLKYVDPSGNFGFFFFLAIIAGLISFAATIAALITHSETWRKVAMISGIISVVASLANFGVNLIMASAEQSVGLPILGFNEGKAIHDLGKIVVHLRPPPQVALYYAYQASKTALLAGATAGTSMAITHTTQMASHISNTYAHAKNLLTSGNLTSYTETVRRIKNYATSVFEGTRIGGGIGASSRVKVGPLKLEAGMHILEGYEVIEGGVEAFGEEYVGGSAKFWKAKLSAEVIDGKKALGFSVDMGKFTLDKLLTLEIGVTTPFTPQGHAVHFKGKFHPVRIFDVRRYFRR